LRIWPIPDRVSERNRDLDEVAGATDAIACSSPAFIFEMQQFGFLGDNRARRAGHEFLIDPVSATPEAIKQRNGH
jgi:hypothetical protein